MKLYDECREFKVPLHISLIGLTLYTAKLCIIGLSIYAAYLIVTGGI